jgi:hypothetical protein
MSRHNKHLPTTVAFGESYSLQTKDSAIFVTCTSLHCHNHITTSAATSSDCQAGWPACFLTISANRSLGREWLLGSTRNIPYHLYLTVLPCGSQGSMFRCMCWQKRWPMKPHANLLAHQLDRHTAFGVTEARDEGSSTPPATPSSEESPSKSCDTVQGRDWSI